MEPNKLYKIPPVTEHVRTNCMEIEPEPNHSINEQIVSAKTRFSGTHQFNPKKPPKWTFKNFVRAGSSGIMYDCFFRLLQVLQDHINAMPLLLSKN